MKKVTLKHLSQRHDIPMKDLRIILESEGLIKKGARKVVKKPAKKAIRGFLATKFVDTGIAWLTRPLAWLTAALSLLALVFLGRHLIQGVQSEQVSMNDLVQMQADVQGAEELVEDSVADQHGSAADVALPSTLPQTGSKISR